MNIVLLEPEIPFNTGAIGRTCVATGTPTFEIVSYESWKDDNNKK